MSGTSHLLSPAKIAEVKRLAKKKLNNSAIPARPASRARRPELPAPVARQGVAHLDRGRGLDFPPPSPRQASWWLLKQTDELEKQEREHVKELTRLNPEIKTAGMLAKGFQELARQRRERSFDQWRATRSHVRERMPTELRAAIVKLARQFPPALIRRVLKVDPWRLRGMMPELQDEGYALA